MRRDQATVADLQREIDRLRDGEEGGFIEGTIPTPGQYLRRLHTLDTEQRIQSLTRLIDAGEVAHFCTMNMHEANLQELRQSAMGTWSALSRIANLCYDPDRDGILHVSEVVELLPKGLIRG